MKTRNGFVSNSSSASFVIIGYQMKELGLDKLSDEEKTKMIREYNPERLDEEYYKKYGIDDAWYDFINNSDNFMGIKGITCIDREGTSVVGVKIVWVSSDDSDIDDQEISLDEVSATIKKFQDKMGISKSPKIITGTVAC